MDAEHDAEVAGLEIGREMGEHGAADAGDEAGQRHRQQPIGVDVDALHRGRQVVLAEHAEDRPQAGELEEEERRHHHRQ